MKIIVTGGGGFLGQKVVDEIRFQYPKAQIEVPRSKDVDLRERQQALSYFEKQKADVIIGIAARLGGIGDNRKHPANYFYDNMMIGMNTVDGARLSGASKLILIGTVCSYPKITPVPFIEEDLWNGYPEATNGAYGISKKAVSEYALAINQQYGLPVVNLLLTNLYGPGDDFREETSHVIPALIKKILDAKRKGEDQIIAWGDGSPTRDFMHVRDAAKGIVNAIRCTYTQPINLGSGQEVSIKELYDHLCKHLNFDGSVYWDTSYPNGQPKRLLDISKAKKYLDFQPNISFDQGIAETISWYLENEDYLNTLKPKHQ
jgi:GDP-L-fucose synthase